MLEISPSEAQALLSKGGVIAYPTEAVYGLGCDPDNETAIAQLLAIKQRPWQKGLILVAGEYSQLSAYIDATQLSAEQLNFAHSKWPGPYTFIMPVKEGVSKLLSGSFDSIAVRVSAHAGIQALCHAMGKPIVSTSANLSGSEPALTPGEIRHQFEGMIAGLVSGDLGEQESPSTIIEAKSGKILRKG